MKAKIIDCLGSITGENYKAIMVEIPNNCKKANYLFPEHVILRLSEFAYKHVDVEQVLATIVERINRPENKE